MTVHLSPSHPTIKAASLQITGSKSETNRLLLLQALYPKLHINNVSSSDDSSVLMAALQNNANVIDVHHAGTAMRFLTAYFAAKKGASVILTGSTRMQQRPIGVLVDALRQLGADITYVKDEGFPPLRISGKPLENTKASLRADVSSQFISALLLIAPCLPNGLELTLQGTITSRPYIDMTLGLLDQLDIPFRFQGNTIAIQHKKNIKEITIVVESDWSSASYFYSLVALSENTTITLSHFRAKSLQGDSLLPQLYKGLGVATRFNENDRSITLYKNDTVLDTAFSADLSNTPDIAQTIAVTCFGLGLACHLSGLHTLKIKETNRLLALQTELTKLGAKVQITDNSLHLEPASGIHENTAIETYDDHRMAMAFAPLALKTPISILDSDVVAKSFPTFWEDIEKVGVLVQKA